jgi:hypothetical protein
VGKESGLPTVHRAVIEDKAKQALAKMTLETEWEAFLQIFL